MALDWTGLNQATDHMLDAMLFAGISQTKSAPELPVETCIGYVEAWRWWDASWDGEDISLASTGVDYLWEPGENVAIGDREKYPHIKNVELHNSVGFHAFKKDGIEQLSDDVFGRVALYGMVAEHTLGYRAEKARILDLWVSPELWEKMQFYPKVRGTFTLQTEPSRIVDARGFSYGEQTWLTLANQCDGLSSSPSDSPRMRLPIRNRMNQNRAWGNLSRNLWESPLTELKVMPDGRYQNSRLYASLDKRAIVRPAGDYCPYCQKRILDGEAVAVNHVFPYVEEFYRSVLDETFQMKQEMRHLSCESQVLFWLDDHSMFQTYVSITRNTRLTMKPRSAGISTDVGKPC